MTLVGVFGVLLGLFAALRAFVRPTRVRIAIFIFAYLMHLAATLLYYRLVQGVGADSALYYDDLWNSYRDGFGLSTQFVIYITQVVKSIVGGTYLDFFLLFQAFGFIGLVLMMRIFEEIYAELEVEQPAYIYLLLFLPSLHYWTSAIGKDGLFFLGITCCLWAMMRLGQRLWGLGFGITLLFLIRPHIALIVIAALGFSFVRDRALRPAVRVLLSIIALGGVALAVVTIRTTFQMDIVNANALSDMLAGREAILQTEYAGRSAVHGGYPIRVFSLLLRPFFFDANGGLGLIVSAENAILLLILAMLAFRWRAYRELSKSVLFVRYAMISSVGILLLMAIGYYNVGLGIRQKATMILPGILVTFAAVMALTKARKQQVRQLGPTAPVTALA